MSRPPKYPWAEWLDAPEPIHVDCHEWSAAPKSLQLQALAAARARDKAITTRRCRRHDECVVIANRRQVKPNWEQLLNGGVHAVWYAELRPIQPESFIRTAREQAKRRGLSIEVNRTHNEAGMTIQAVPQRVRFSQAG